MVAPDRFLSIDQIEHLNWVQTNDLYKIELFEIKLIIWLCERVTDVIHSNAWNHLILMIYAKLNC